MIPIKENAYGFRTKLLFFAERIEEMRKRVGKSEQKVRILDVGCGNGTQVTQPLGALGIHEPSIAQANKINQFANVKFVCGGFDETRKEAKQNGKFDVIVFSDILEHLKNPAEFLNSAGEILADGGIVLVSIPNGHGPFEIENFILRKTGILSLAQKFRRGSGVGEQTLNHDNGHVQFFTLRKMRHLLERCGLEVSNFKKGAFLCGPISGRLIGLSKWLIKFNLEISRFLPAQMCSVWYFQLTQK
jgi:SAM-dependent methyltransferase